MAYAITDFSRIAIDYAAVGGVLYKMEMRAAELGAWPQSPVAFAAGTPPLKGLKMAHIYAHALNGTKLLRKKFPINGNVAPPAPGTNSTVTVDGLTWVADGYVGERRREE